MINEVVCEINKFEFKIGINSGEKFPKKHLWRCIGWIILSVSYGKRGYRYFKVNHMNLIVGRLKLKF